MASTRYPASTEVLMPRVPGQGEGRPADLIAHLWSDRCVSEGAGNGGLDFAEAEADGFTCRGEGVGGGSLVKLPGGDHLGCPACGPVQPVVAFARLGVEDGCHGTA